VNCRFYLLSALSNLIVLIVVCRLYPYVGIVSSQTDIGRNRYNFLIHNLRRHSFNSVLVSQPILAGLKMFPLYAKPHVCVYGLTHGLACARTVQAHTAYRSYRCRYWKRTTLMQLCFCLWPSNAPRPKYFFILDSYWLYAIHNYCVASARTWARQTVYAISRVQ